MDRIASILLMASLFMSFSTVECNGAEAPDKKLHKECLYPTICVASVDETSFGSGVIVLSKKINYEYINFFISSAHVIEKGTDYNVLLHKYEDWSTVVGVKKIKCKFYAKHKKRDLIIGAFLTKTAMPSAKINMKIKFYIGTKLFRIGCGLGDVPRLEYGIVSAPIMKKGGPATLNTVRTSIQTVPGDSGGPVFDRKYQVVGVTKAIKYYRSQLIFGTGYIVPITDLGKWSNENNKRFHFLWEDRVIPTMFYYRMYLLDSHKVTSK